MVCLCDHHHAEPYLHASPWAGRIDGFFDDPGFKGAARTYGRLAAEAEPRRAAIDFLRQAHERIRERT